MRIVVALGLAGVLCSSGTILAQNHTVFPSDHTGTGASLTKPGASSAYNNPYSYGVARQMFFYDRWDVRIPNGRQIARIGFPRDENISSTGYGVQVKVQMGQSTNRLANVSSTFAQNYTTTPTNVFASATGGGKILMLPNLGPPSGTDVVWLPLDVPFTFDATKSLVIDYQVYANQNGNNSFYYYLDVAQHASPQRSFGQACQTSGGLTPSVASSSTGSYIGGNWQINLQNGPSTTPMALLVGLTSFEPGVSLTPIGMPGCLMSIDPIWAGGYVTYSGGWYSWSFPVPNVQALFGGRLYDQVVMQDVFANPFGFITSNGDELTFGILPQMTLIYGNQGDAQASTGYLYPNFGLITIFEHN